MQVVLVMFRSDGERRSFSVVRNMTVIGRREDCDLRIPVGEVSRKHCRLVLTDDGVRIEDLGSSNGTWVNGGRVQESDLSPGDVVTVGPVQFVMQINGVPDDDSLVAPTPAAPTVDEDSMMGYESPTTSLKPAGNDLTLDEDPAQEELADDEFQIVDTSPAPQAPIEEFSLEEEPLAQVPIARAPLEKPTLEAEFTLEETPAAGGEAEALPEADLPIDEEDDLKLPEFPAAASAPVEDEFEMPDLEAAPESTAPAASKSPDDSEWDFVIEETESESTPGEFDIDLDSSHQQPHGN